MWCPGGDQEPTVQLNQSYCLSLRGKPRLAANSELASLSHTLPLKHKNNHRIYRPLSKGSASMLRAIQIKSTFTVSAKSRLLSFFSSLCHRVPSLFPLSGSHRYAVEQESVPLQTQLLGVPGSEPHDPRRQTPGEDLPGSHRSVSPQPAPCPEENPHSR